MTAGWGLTCLSRQIRKIPSGSCWCNTSTAAYYGQRLAEAEYGHKPTGLCCAYGRSRFIMILVLRLRCTYSDVPEVRTSEIWDVDFKGWKGDGE